MDFIAATGNKNKVIEFGRILAPLGIKIITLAQAGTDDRGIVEDGDTFAANARIKAQAIYARTGKAVIADDSGLCVDALDGRPGVLSARYMGEDAGYDIKMAGLLRELEGVEMERRTASFVAAVCCILPGGDMLEVQGECRGFIGFEPSGTGGFGYDPLFLVDGKSFGDLSPREKDKHSHRGKALAALYTKLERTLPKGEIL